MYSKFQIFKAIYLL